MQLFSKKSYIFLSFFSHKIFCNSKKDAPSGTSLIYEQIVRILIMF